jgi:hypothetical protein
LVLSVFSVRPITGLPVELHDCYDDYLITFELIDHPVREAL